MSKKRNKKKPNPVYLRGLEEGVGQKTMDKLYEAFGIRLDITDEEEKELDRKWGRFK